MGMSSDDIIHHMACDMSQWICVLIPDWPYPDTPGCDYTDAVTLIFGDAPTKESVVKSYRKKQLAKLLCRHLNKSGETQVVTVESADALIRRLIRNNFGSEDLD